MKNAIWWSLNKCMKCLFNCKHSYPTSASEKSRVFNWKMLSQMLQFSKVIFSSQSAGKHVPLTWMLTSLTRYWQRTAQTSNERWNTESNIVTKLSHNRRCRRWTTLAMKNLFERRIIIISAKFNHTVKRPFLKFEECHSYNRAKTTFDRLKRHCTSQTQERKFVHQGANEATGHPPLLLASPPSICTIGWIFHRKTKANAVTLV